MGFQVPWNVNNGDGTDIFKDLGDLGNLAGLAKGGNGFSGSCPLFEICGEAFLELSDLEDPLEDLPISLIYEE